jgi:hypothetical protein
MEKNTEEQKPERRTKTVYLTDDMLRQYHDSGMTIGDIFRAGLAAKAPLRVPDELTKATAVLGDVLTKLAMGWTLVPPAEPDVIDGPLLPEVLEDPEGEDHGTFVAEADEPQGGDITGQ